MLTPGNPNLSPVTAYFLQLQDGRETEHVPIQVSAATDGGPDRNLAAAYTHRSAANDTVRAAHHVHQAPAVSRSDPLQPSSKSRTTRSANPGAQQLWLQGSMALKRRPAGLSSADCKCGMHVERHACTEKHTCQDLPTELYSPRPVEKGVENQHHSCSNMTAAVHTSAHSLTRLCHDTPSNTHIQPVAWQPARHTGSNLPVLLSLRPCSSSRHICCSATRAV
jgi:hypothetical protein